MSGCFNYNTLSRLRIIEDVMSCWEEKEVLFFFDFDPNISTSSLMRHTATSVGGCFQALKTEQERALAAKEQESEEKRKSLFKQIRDLESELENERRGKVLRCLILYSLE
uniref:Myosin tail domain-containing protein n=1 Tax=Parascaris equorum TaxID=6256 RepID=A0A914RVH2_PAREQ